MNKKKYYNEYYIVKSHSKDGINLQWRGALVAVNPSHLPSLLNDRFWPWLEQKWEIPAKGTIKNDVLVIFLMMMIIRIAATITFALSIIISGTSIVVLFYIWPLNLSGAQFIAPEKNQPTLWAVKAKSQARCVSFLHLI